MSIIKASQEFARAGVLNTKPFEGIQLPFRLMPHQVLGLNSVLVRPKSGLFFEARTGKTIVFQLAAIYLANYGIKTVILMPPILFEQFLESWHEIKGNTASIHLLRHSAATRTRKLNHWYQTGTFPDILLMTKEIFKKVFPGLLNSGFSSLVFDESHLGLMRANTKTYQAVQDFSSGSHSRLILSTGTPIPSGIEGAFPAIRLINPGAYLDEAHFYRTHVIMKQIKTKTRVGADIMIEVPGSYKALDHLHRNLYRYAVRATKQEVLDIKSPNIQTIPITLSSAHLSMYRLLLKQRVMEIGERVISAIQAQKLRQLALQMVTSPNEYSEKRIKNSVTEGVEALMHSAGIDRGEKVVVFANYRQSIRTLASALKKYNPRTVYGDNSPAVNQESVSIFRNDPQCQVIILNPVAGGVGLKFGDISTTCILAEPMSSPGQFDQALSRIILSGQPDPVVCYILQVNNTISTKAIESMMDRNQQIKRVNRDQKSLLDELFIN